MLETDQLTDALAGLAALHREGIVHGDLKPGSFGVNVNSPDEMRKAVRLFLKYGVDSIKLNLSGDNFIWSPEEAARNGGVACGVDALEKVHVEADGARDAQA